MGSETTGHGQFDEITRLRAELAEARERLSNPHVLEDAATAIRIHDGVLALKEENRRLRDALFQFEYPPDPAMLRDIAEDIDCGSECTFSSVEWDTNAHICSRESRDEGCAGSKAGELRQFADAIETRAALAKAKGGGDGNG